MFEILQIGFMEFLGFCGFIQNQRFKDPLTKQEEQHYLLLHSQGDKEARNVLIERNLRLVAHIVKKYDINVEPDFLANKTEGEFYCEMKICVRKIRMF